MPEGTLLTKLQILAVLSGSSAVKDPFPFCLTRCMVKQFGKKCRNLTERKLLYPEESCQIAIGQRFFRMLRGIEAVSPGPEVKNDQITW